LHANIETIIIESFQSPFEEIKSAASYALGNIAVSNLSRYLPFILDQIDNQQKKQYLLLHSLKEVWFFSLYIYIYIINLYQTEGYFLNHVSFSNLLNMQVIVRQSVDKAEFQDSIVEKILKLLFNHCESDEEGVRNVVAECLGKIALVEPAKLVPALKVSNTSNGILGFI